MGQQTWSRPIFPNLSARPKSPPHALAATLTEWGPRVSSLSRAPAETNRLTPGALLSGHQPLALVTHWLVGPSRHKSLPPRSWTVADSSLAAARLSAADSRGVVTRGIRLPGLATHFSHPSATPPRSPLPAANKEAGWVKGSRRRGISDSIVVRTVEGAWGLPRARGKAAVAASPRIGRLWCRNCSPELGIRRSPGAEQGASRFDVSFLSLLSCSCSLCIVAFNSKFE
jgi:hypothetical protein